MHGAGPARVDRVWGVHVKRGIFGKRLRAWCVSKRDALRNNVADSRRDAGVDQVLRTDLSKQRIAGERPLHVVRMQPLRQVGQLMNHGRGLRGEHCRSQCFRIEHVNDSRLYSR